MAEERICICKMPSCYSCGHCKDDCIKKITYNKGIKNISVKEAIEKMANAMFERERPGCRGEVPIEDVWQDLKDRYLTLAEAALNALLEEK